MSVPITALKGIKTVRAAQLAKLGIYTTEDLFELFPRGYEDRSRVIKLCRAVGGESATVLGYIQSADTYRINRSNTVTNLKIKDDTGYMRVSVFNGKYKAKPFKIGELYAFYGKINADNYGLSMTNPAMTLYKDGWDRNFFGIQPIYPLTQGITQNFLRKIIAEAFAAAPPKYETLPKEIITKYKLLRRDIALNNIHFPKNMEDSSQALMRFKFEELFKLQLMLLLLKDAEKKINNAISFKNSHADKTILRFISSLPFNLTEGQQNVWREISENMDSDKSMNRLVIGDVGSGKTVLAVLAMLKAALSDYQAVFMAPTEILAEQHYATVSKMLTPFGINVLLVTGSLGAKEKNIALKKIKSGEAKCIIGTHALIQPSVEYKRLGLAITDEQHRFGVRQRARLAEQEMTPDVLVMTATPIPRTLALILYGDMDISALKMRPQGRLPIKTYALDYSMYDRICKWIIKLAQQGRQIYMVYPLIEEGETAGLKSVTEAYKALSSNVFKELSCDLLHGKMSAEEKEKVMRSFKEGKTQILFSTTVVEVGVDIPNAALMVVENAERFGLAQLHQLRGRVGRGEHQSYCVLFSEKVTERMKLMEQFSDGFVLSEEDLRLRGPGDFFGVEQHGLPPLKVANLYKDTEILRLSSEAAREVVTHRDDFCDYLKYLQKKYPDRVQL